MNAEIAYLMRWIRVYVCGCVHVYVFSDVRQMSCSPL